MTPAQQLNAKLKLERQILKTLTRYHQAVVAQFLREYESAAAVPDMDAFNPPLSNILNQHYLTVADVFSPVITEATPDDVQATPGEKAAISAALAVFFAGRAEEQARIINGTTRDEMAAAASDAVSVEPNLAEAASIAAAALIRNLIARSQSIAATETQTAAEATKLTAADVLLGRQPSIQGGTAAETEITKDWWSVGDSRVRAAHLIADGQRVKVSAPFVVEGQKLMYPGDTSLGASPSNTINCRCIAEYDTTAIAEERRTRL